MRCPLLRTPSAALFYTRVAGVLGGPVFGADGSVIGVNFAITRDFDGSNFGIPVRFARELLP